ncbi:MAG: hypothetical protein PGN24_05265 [Microbacterium arborescens]
MPRGRSTARRVLLHPLLWAPLLFVAALPLLGTEHDFWGFLLSMFSGWLVAHAIVGGLLRLTSAALAISLHITAAVAAAALAFALTQPGGWRDAAPASVIAGIGFAVVPAAGWLWLALIGRISGALGAGARRRAATLVEPGWSRDGDTWTLALPAVPLRSATFAAVTGGLAAAGTALLSAFLLVFDDIAQRMTPLLIIVALGWVFGMPVYLVLRAIAHARTADVRVTVTAGVDGRVRVLRPADGAVVLDASLRGIRSIRWYARSAPTRIVIHPARGGGRVLLVGLARRSKNAAATYAMPPTQLLRALDAAGLRAQTRRPRDDRLVIERRDVETERART